MLANPADPDGSGYLSINSKEMEEELPVIYKAYGLIRDYWPEIESHVGTSIRTIHLVKSPYMDRHMSCTSEQFFGSILASTGDEYQLAEGLAPDLLECGPLLGRLIGAVMFFVHKCLSIS